jgi:hypothetical protein
MAWIESHTTLREHPKTKRLCRLLGINRREAIGLLHILWWWVLDFAPEGDLSDFSDEDIADSIDWEHDAQLLVAGLTQAGFMDEDRRVHDWDEFAEKWIARRRANAERMRLARAGRNGTADSKGSPHVRDTSGARAAQKSKSVGLPDQPDQPYQPDQLTPFGPPSDVQTTNGATAPTKPKAGPSNPSTSSKTPPPDTLEPSEADLAAGREQGLDAAQVGRAATAMLDHWRAKGEVRADWHASLRTWLRNAPKFDQQRAPPSSNGQAAHSPTDDYDYENDPDDILPKGRYTRL